MTQMSVTIWRIDRVVFDEIISCWRYIACWEAIRFSVERKERTKGDRYELSDFVIWEAERIRFQNARLVDYCD